ncbi:hypothetical protein GCM10010145_44300 [Streptomyces ruber]|uniref:T6SS Phospholipase effector Tle1-like catalytic domain-containing protein n=3 Tax=Streptomyces TaxID=1883 RepID=A0A918BK62_9ACTN|nr:DUF2235 domain-containing protein [Streptomyces ruber]GGQ69640.1 hypothetical protein GCM10010145_44300 [Streptomyces ruber]
MRCLVVCCDGTWNTSTQPSVTNVFRLYNALDTTDAEGNEQPAVYQSGVGTRGGLRAWLHGGIAGAGLSYDIQDVYRWLTTRYEPGDRIALFGFSRGAYTVRSLAGMIATCGLPDLGGRDDTGIRTTVRRVYDEGYRRSRRDSSWRDGLDFLYDPRTAAAPFPVHFIGVWDTVGSLGIPDNLGSLDLGGAPGRYAFHNTQLDPRIPYARHAVALDEHRGPFTPALWDESQKGPRQDLLQAWFPGSHMDVGGGHPETGLSDGALLWMAEAARAAGLGFDKAMLTQITPDARDVLHEDERSSFRLLAPLYDPLIGPLLQPFFATRPRAVPLIDAGARTGTVHASAYERRLGKILTSPPYRPGRVLGVGDEETAEVSARSPWNATGLYLAPGDYEFTAEGEWRDALVWSGPEGTTGRARFNPLGEGLRLLGTLLRLRREDDLPWMSLVAVVANGNGSAPHQRIAVGRRATARVEVDRGGYLYAFANDAWGFYGTNAGSVRLTVTRTA